MVKHEERRTLPYTGENAPNQIVAKIVKYTIGYGAVGLFRIEFEDEHYVPNGACIIAGNHTSYVDPVAIWMTPDKGPVHFVGRDEFYKFKPIAWFLDSVGAIPVARNSADRTMMRAVEAQLAQGEKVGIFPEGTRGRDRDDLGELGKANEGVAFMAIRSNVPVIPVGISGLDKIWPKGKIFPRFPKAICKFGPPIHPEDFEGNRKEVLHAMTQMIMDEITRLRDEAAEEIASRSLRKRRYFTKD